MTANQTSFVQKAIEEFKNTDLEQAARLFASVNGASLISSGVAPTRAEAEQFVNTANQLGVSLGDAQNFIQNPTTTAFTTKRSRRSDGGTRCHAPKRRSRVGGRPEHDGFYPGSDD